MIVRYWSPLQDVDAIRRQFDRIFDDLAPAAQAEAVWSPAIALSDRGNELELKILLPGITPDELDIQASRDTVAVSGQSHRPELAEGQKMLHNEFRYGTFRRVVNLPVEVEHEAIAAHYADGVLTLTLPKVAAERNKVVKVALKPAAEAQIAAAEEHEAQ